MLEQWWDPWGLKKLEKLLSSRGGFELPIVVLTGAGISKESGLATFRGNGGMWEGHRIEYVAHPEGLKNNPQLVLSFYNQRRKELLRDDISPNAAHWALAKLEQELGEVSIITQNVDNLHERAGSEQLIHIHGELFRNKCSECKYSWASRDPMNREIKCPVCQVKAVRPDVVFFKETPYRMDDTLRLVNQAKVFISIGTSGVVYPAAQLVVNAKRQGALCIEINPEGSATSKHFDLVIRKPASEAVPKLVDFLITR